MSDGSEHRSDADLAQAVCGGDRSVFAVLMERYLPDVYAVAVRVLCNAAEAEDLAQDTFVRAFERLNQYRRAYAFKNWLLKIATNLAINRLRSRRRQRHLHARVAEEYRPPDDAVDCPSRYEWDYWLAQLDEKSRTAIVLFHFHEMSYAEVAQTLGVPLNTVRTYIHRGRKRLRKLMTNDATRENQQWNVVM
jgi:RNA polymerase sigma-70 factor (ECF subfamily)